MDSKGDQVKVKLTNLKFPRTNNNWGSLFFSGEV